MPPPKLWAFPRKRSPFIPPWWAGLSAGPSPKSIGSPREVRALTVTYLRNFKEAILGWCDESLAVLDSYRSGGGNG